MLYLGNPLDLCYSVTEKFDVIDCSDLADNIGLANLIVAAGLRLSEEIESVLLQETSYWKASGSTILDYIEEALCAPLSVLPSIYGLRLVYPSQFGATVPPDSNPVVLTWKRTSPYENLRPDFLPSYLPWLTRLALKCFSSSATHSVETFGMIRYTPLTFFYVLMSAAERMGRGFDALKQCEVLLSKLGKPFELAWRTLSRWAWIAMLPKIGTHHLDQEAIYRVLQHLSQCPGVTLLSSHVPFNRIELAAYCDARKRSLFLAPPILRVILMPHDCYENFALDKPVDISAYSDVYCIDNVQLDFNKKPDNSHGWFTVSFPLISNHELRDTHSAVVVEVQTGKE